ncbi:NAD(P)H-dependent oxidoreductase subunit E [Myxococcota bacterium]
MSESVDIEIVLPIIAKHRGRPGGHLSILHEIQDIFGYLPRSALQIVAEQTDSSLVDVYGLASFGESFRLQPPHSPTEAIDKKPDRSGATRPVRCKRCNHTLMDRECFIDSRPSVHITVAFGLEHGSFWFSSKSGQYEILSEYEFPKTGAVDFFCPHCNAEIFTSENCAKCGAPMVPILLGVGIIRPICSNDGCGLRKAIA